MTGIDSYSTTPATNATADGGAINWSEGQPPSSVNNTARQMCADIRSRNNDLMWFVYGTGDQGAGNIAVPAVYASGTSFTIAGVDVTATYHIGRRLRAVGSSTGTIYGSITASSFSTNTTITAQWDSGSLSNETLVISLSQIPVTGAPVGGPIRFPSVQVANSNANTLDDYDERTFSPVLTTDSTNFTSVTYNAGRYALYTKIGRQVFFSLRMTTDAVTVGPATGSILISGLPATASSSGHQAVTVGLSQAWTTNNPMSAVVLAGTSTISLFYRATSVAATTAMAVANVATGASANDIVISGSYMV